MKPAGHVFSYPVFYFGVNLDDAEKLGGGWWKWLVGWESRSIFSIWGKDYLGDVPGTVGGVEAVGIKEKVLRHLEHMDIPRDEIDHIELVTMPRFFGLAFNPLNTYYCFGKSEEGETRLRATLLEVNNTFGERHLYLCDPRSAMEKIRTGYTSSHALKRSFHVSPFNNRTGYYEAHLLDPSLNNRMDVSLVLTKYSDGHNTENGKHFYARVHADARPLNGFSLIHLVALHPVTAFLTLPRIMYEAWRLAYKKNLGVYQRPNPYRVEAGVGGDGGTIVRKKLDWFQKYSETTVLQHFQTQSNLHSIHLRLIMPDKQSIDIQPSPAAKAQPPATLHINSPNFFLRLLMDGNHIGRALSTTFSRGDYTATDRDLTAFFRLMRIAPDGPAFPPNQRNDVLAKARDWYHAGMPEPFESQRWACVPSGVVTDVENRKIAYGIWTVWFEEWWFRRTTVFVRDPYGLAGRVVEHLRSVGEDFGNGDGGERLVGEFRDEVGPEVRELERVRGFARIVKELL
ncbi:hypothetical protein HDU97_001301 [Phlyctochytrium planicorne]|nr:hypothetical protein HDU97_001301 [Phlyctochytrium planicorne]